MLNLVCALLVILTTGFWAFQGFFSAVIMFCETVIALMTAFSFYEPMADYWKDSLNPELGQAGFLFIIFFITLIVLRVLSDKFITGTIRAHQLIDRIGGGVFGLLTGLILVGVMLISIQMLPIGRTTFGFERVSLKTGRTNNVWFNPDGFTIGLANMLSDERFSSDRNKRLDLAKPEMLTDLTLRRSGTQAESRRIVPPEAIEIVDIYRVDQIHDRVINRDSAEIKRDTTKIADKNMSDGSYIVCRVKVITEKSKEQNSGDILFTPAQFRLVGPRPPADGRAQTPKVFFATGLSDIYIPAPYDRGGGSTPIKIDEETAAVLVKMAPDTPLVLNEDRDKALMKDAKGYEIDVVFEVPGETFEPWYIEFKNGGRKEIPASKKIERKSPDEAGETGEEEIINDSAKSSGKTKADATSGSGKKASGKSGKKSSMSDTKSADKGGKKPKVIVGEQTKGRTSVNAQEKGTGPSDELPYKLPKSESSVANKSRGPKFHDGHLIIEISDKELADDDAVTHFDVPEGKVMVQVRVSGPESQSFLGNALSYAKNTLNQYFLATDDGTQFWAQGKFIVGVENGKRVMEMQYWYEPLQIERCLETETRWTPNRIKSNSSVEYGFIFLVDPGVTIKRFHRSAKDAQDLVIEVPR